MNLKNSFISSLIAFSMLSSCSSAYKPPIQASKTPTANAIISPSAQAGFSLTAEPSLTTTIYQPVSTSCVASDESNSTGIRLSGVAVLEKISETGKTIFLRDLEKPNTIELSPPGSISFFLGVSPDRRKLLYEYDTFTDDAYRLAISNSKGDIILDFDNKYQQVFWDYYNWLNNQQIRVVTLNTDMVFAGSYNPFTQEYQSLPLHKWADSYKGEGPDWGVDGLAISLLYLDGTNIIYDPTLKRVVYPKKNGNIALVDVESGKELANMVAINWGKLPRWSPDGKNLILIANINQNSTKMNDEFFLVSRDGPQFQQITHLSSIFERDTISEYAWSPDGKRIAFLLNTVAEDASIEGVQSDVAVLDIETGEVTNLCFQAVSAVNHSPVLFENLEPVWSPDGTQIMVFQWSDGNNEANKNYALWVLDIPSLTAVKIDENKQPVGWMIKEP